MCTGPFVNGPNTSTTPPPAARQTSQGIAEASPDVWKLLAEKGGTMGDIARQKLQEMNTRPAAAFPVIPRTK